MFTVFRGGTFVVRSLIMAFGFYLNSMDFLNPIGDLPPLWLLNGLLGYFEDDSFFLVEGLTAIALLAIGVVVCLAREVMLPSS